MDQPHRAKLLACLLAAVLYSGPALATSLVSGIDADSGIAELSPARSALVAVADAGFVRDGSRLGFYWVLTPLAPLVAPLYARVTYSNPCGEPLVNDAMLPTALEKIGLSSPDYVRGLEEGRTYTFRLEIFQAQGDATPIDVIEQKVVSPFTGQACG